MTLVEARARVASMTGAERLLAAARRQPVDATPVWFMRQAGRSLADYRHLKERYDILTMTKTPELCARVTLMPVEAHGVDGAVMLADIMVPLEGMGAPFHIEENVGPIIHHPIRTREDVDALRVADPRESVPYILEAIGLVKRELSDGRAAVIGFCGSPYTLACYLIEGRPSRDYALAKSMMMSQPALWASLMNKLTDQMVAYLQAQIQAGADIVQVFDSWVGGLNPVDYERSVLPWTRRIFDALRGGGAPTIYFGTGNAALLGLMASAGSDVMSVDWRVNLDDAWQEIGLDRPIQGNLDPVRAVAGWEAAREGMRDILDRAAGQPGHLFNLGHGVLPATDPSVLKRLVEEVHAATAR